MKVRFISVAPYHNGSIGGELPLVPRVGDEVVIDIDPLKGIWEVQKVSWLVSPVGYDVEVKIA